MLFPLLAECSIINTPLLLNAGEAFLEDVNEEAVHHATGLASSSPHATSTLLPQQFPTGTALPNVRVPQVVSETLVVHKPIIWRVACSQKVDLSSSSGYSPASSFDQQQPTSSVDIEMPGSSRGSANSLIMAGSRLDKSPAPPLKKQMEINATTQFQRMISGSTATHTDQKPKKYVRALSRHCAPDSSLPHNSSISKKPSSNTQLRSSSSAKPNSNGEFSPIPPKRSSSLKNKNIHVQQQNPTGQHSTALSKVQSQRMTMPSRIPTPNGKGGHPAAGKSTQLRNGNVPQSTSSPSKRIRFQKSSKSKKFELELPPIYESEEDHLTPQLSGRSLHRNASISNQPSSNGDHRVPNFHQLRSSISSRC